ncbi:MAG: S8 family serine peptidase [Chlorobi bacterium]|nr:S8 family serine peptidase [Chlorobiota bacterium]
MHKIFTFMVFSLIGLVSFSQVAPNKYWVKFTDKNNSPYSIDNPGEFLSQRALDRRTAQGIEIEENDLPANPAYVQGVMDVGATILNVSKWFNSTVIYTTSSSVVNAINALPYVLSVEKAGGSNPSGNDTGKPFFKNESFSQIPEGDLLKSGTSGDSYDYGQAYNQINMLNGIPLHDAGFDGAGMIIAVLDAGFLNVNSLTAFDSLWNNNQILGTRDFVNPQNPNIFNSHYHGSMVLSTMGANLPGQMVGTAPKASYWLIRTEDAETEYLVEELNWVAGAELADSLGADVINSSLGYTTFDDPSQDHSYSDMDGNTTPITIGADIAVSKGVLVCNSAGNSGGSFWQYIGAPADGNDVFSIGAVDGNGNYASFSSTGPTSDGRIKPNVVAQGAGSTIISPWDGTVSTGSGTSFSSPITAGIVACLWQANPDKRNMEIMEAIQESATLAGNPNNQLGWGIPDYSMANSILTVIDNEMDNKASILTYPNPFNDELFVSMKDVPGEISSIELFDLTGKIILSKKVNGSLEQSIKLNGAENLDAGIYFMQVTINNTVVTQKVIKR